MTIVDHAAKTDGPLAASEVLQALDLPPEAVPLFLAHIDAFCAAHGGERHYAELMALVQRCRAAAEAR